MNFKKLIEERLILDCDDFYHGAKRVCDGDLEKTVANGIWSKSQIELIYMIGYIKCDLSDFMRLEVTSRILEELWMKL